MLRTKLCTEQKSQLSQLVPRRVLGLEEETGGTKTSPAASADAGGITNERRSGVLHCRLSCTDLDGVRFQAGTLRAQREKMVK